MREDFQLVSGYNPNIEIAEEINLEVAQRNVDHARTLDLQTVWQKRSEIFPDNITDRDIIVIGAGPSLNQKNSSDQTLLDEVDARHGFKVLASMSARLLKEGALDNGCDCVVLGAFGSERINALKQGGDELIEKLKDTKILAPTYMQPEVFQYLIDNGLRDNIYLWEPHVDGLEGAVEPAFFPGSTGANAATSIIAGMVAGSDDKSLNIEYYGVDTSGAAENKPIYADPVKNLRETNTRSNQDVVITVGEKQFVATAGFLHEQTEEFVAIMKGLGRKISPQFHGDNLNAALFNPAGNIASYELGLTTREPGA